MLKYWIEEDETMAFDGNLSIKKLQQMNATTTC